LGKEGELQSSELRMKDNYITLSIAFAPREKVTEETPVQTARPRAFNDSFDDSFG